jgi:serine/threonine-protein kinase
MGSIWVARHLQLETDVAVKLMDVKLAKEPEARGRFAREAKASAMLHGPHVVEVHDYGVDEGIPYMAMELLEGEDLGARLRREQRLPLSAIVDIVHQIAKALRRAHAAGVLHRDLKPSNIFLARALGDQDEVVKVLDFGVAKVTSLGTLDDATRTGTMIGSPRYMSPEQARGLKGYDHRSDLWSLAVIAYRALTGEVPFVGVSVGDTLYKICSEEAPRPSSLARELDAEIDRFFERAFQKDPDRRFQTAEELATALIRIAPRLAIPPPEPSSHAEARPSSGGARESAKALHPEPPSEEKTEVTPPRLPERPSDRTVPEGRAAGDDVPGTTDVRISWDEPTDTPPKAAPVQAPASPRRGLWTTAPIMILSLALVMLPAEKARVGAPPPRAMTAELQEAQVSPAPSPPVQPAPSEPRRHVEARLALGRLREGMRTCVQRSLQALPGSSPAVPARLEQTAGAGYTPVASDWFTPVWSCARFRVTGPMGFQIQWQILQPGVEGRGIAWTDDDGDGRVDHAIAFRVALKTSGALELGEIEPVDPSSPSR